MDVNFTMDGNNYYSYSCVSDSPIEIYDSINYHVDVVVHFPFRYFDRREISTTWFGDEVDADKMVCRIYHATLVVNFNYALVETLYRYVVVLVYINYNIVVDGLTNVRVLVH